MLLPTGDAEAGDGLIKYEESQLAHWAASCRAKVSVPQLRTREGLPHHTVQYAFLGKHNFTMVARSRTANLHLANIRDGKFSRVPLCNLDRRSTAAKKQSGRLSRTGIETRLPEPGHVADYSHMQVARPLEKQRRSSTPSAAYLIEHKWHLVAATALNWLFSFGSTSRMHS